MLYSLVV